MADIQVETIAETENYTAWGFQEEDGQMLMHLELGSVTIHLFPDQWEEFLRLISIAEANTQKLP